MGKGSSSSAYPQSAAWMNSSSQAANVTPAIAKSIAKDTESAQATQLEARQKMRGVASTYLRGQNIAATQVGKDKLGQ